MQKILLKCLEELKQEVPDVSYLRGMMETLIELDTRHIPSVTATDTPDKITTTPADVSKPDNKPAEMDEAAAMDAAARAALATVKSLSEASAHE